MVHVCENYPELDGVNNFITNCSKESNIDTDKEKHTGSGY